jgi:D-xylose transport system substrate-binding protein
MNLLLTKYKVIAISFALLLIQNNYSQTSKTKIGLLLADLNIERWDKDREYFLLKSKELNYETMVGDALNREYLQIAQADSMIKAGAKILVIIPVDGDSAAIIVEHAHKNGVKVIAYDRLIMNCDLDAYVSYDNDMIGKIMGLYTTLTFKRGTIAYIGGPKSDNNSDAIRKGLMQVLKPYFRDKLIAVVCDTFVNSWSAAESKRILHNFLVKNKCPDVIFTANDELAGGVIDELEEQGLAGKVMVTGQDADLKACRNIVAGKQTLTVFKPVRVLAERAVQLASGLIGDIPFLTITEVYNGKVNVQSLVLVPMPVDVKNIRNSVIREGYHTEEEIFGKIKN